MYMFIPLLLCYCEVSFKESEAPAPLGHGVGLLDAFL